MQNYFDLGHFKLKIMQKSITFEQKLRFSKFKGNAQRSSLGLQREGYGSLAFLWSKNYLLSLFLYSVEPKNCFTFNIFKKRKRKVYYSIRPPDLPTSLIGEFFQKKLEKFFTMWRNFSKYGEDFQGFWEKMQRVWVGHQDWSQSLDSIAL